MAASGDDGVRAARVSAATAASLLFVPATRLDRLAKAWGSGADGVIVDLEDAVGPEDKDRARAEVAALRPPGPCVLRINGTATPFGAGDLSLLARLDWLAAVIVPKVESPEPIAQVRSAMMAEVPVLPLIESAAALRSVHRIAEAGPSRLVFGSADYLADLGAEASAEVLAHPRNHLVVASAAAGLPPPVDGPSLVLDDPAAVEAEARAVRALGMGGKLCIHPAQVPAVNAAFYASEEELAWARAVVDASERAGGGVFALEGRMVDAPVVRRARRMLDRWQQQ